MNIRDLRFNEIEHLPPGSFLRMRNLNTLLLNNNKIGQLNKGTFAGLDDLRYLYMYKNRIRHIDSEAFHDMPKLEQLYLHYNYIEDVSAETFSNLPSIERLFLHNNKLQRIPYGAFSNLTSLKRLRLDSNALICDCRMLWLAHMLKEHASRSVASATCQEPAELNGRSIADIEDQMLRCSAPQLTEQPRNVVITFGKTAYFHCEADGEPQPDIVWLHNRNELDPENMEAGYQILEDGTLMVEPSSDPDAVFECMAKNQMGQVKSRPVTVRYVPSSPQQDDGMPHPGAPEEAPLPPPPPPAVPRSREEELAKEEEEERPARRERQSYYDRRSRVLDSRNREDNRLTTQRRPFQLPGRTREDNLATHSRPRFVRAPQDVHVGVGDVAELVCVVDGYPTPELLWLRGGNAITTQTPRYRLRFAAREANLTIINVQPQDAGEYLCSASNRLGRVSSPAQLVLQSEFTAAPRIALTCRASGSPLPEITWRRVGGNLFADGSVTGRAGSQDGGIYECNVANGVGHRCGYHTPGRRRWPRFPTDEALDQARAGEIFERALELVKRLVESGSRFNLTTYSYSDLLSPGQMERLRDLSGLLVPPAPPQLQQHLLPQPLPQRRRHPANNLQQPLEVSFDGQHECDRSVVASTAVKTHWSGQSAPQLTEQPRNVVITFGKTAYFHCEADGEPQPDIVWLHNRNELDPENMEAGYQILEDGTLMVEPSSDPDAVFECMAKNQMGQVKSRPVTVRYVPSSPQQDDGMPHPGAPEEASREEELAKEEEEERPARRRPRFVRAPQDVHVGVGDVAELVCVVDGYPTPELLWLRGGNAITTQTPRYRLRFAAREANLTIINVQPQDAGEYLCSASNRLGRVSSPAQLVLQSEFTTAPPQDQLRPAGANVDLTCGAVGYPTPEVSWLHNGRRIRHSSRVAVLAGGGVLRISNLQHHDAGTYTCEARNEAAVAREEAELDVSGHAGPVLTERPPMTLTAALGESIALTCRASGSPLPEITWRRVGGNLFADGRHSATTDGALTLRTLTAQDGGIYECNVDNGVGHAVATTHLAVAAAQTSSARPGDQFVSQSAAEATRDVEIALNRTLRQLFSQPRHHRRTPHELLQIFRFPTDEALDQARAGEIFERALELVKRLVESGSRFNLTTYSYSDLLSPGQMERLRDLSGCSSHRRRLNCSNICFHSRYRSADGTCNNLQQPLWGASLVGFRRLLPAQYENGFNTPRGADRSSRYNGFLLPNPRLVSSRLAATDVITEDTEFSAMLMQWGQFVDHDMDHALPAFSEVSFDGQHECDSTCQNVAPCFNIAIPPGDRRQGHHRCMRLVRSSAACGSGSTSVFGHQLMPREQINGLSSFIDGSMIYGNTETQAHHLRNLSYPSGRLRNGIFSRPHRPFMPFNDGVPVDCQRDQADRSDIGCFMAGDVRANEQLGLSAMHTVWLREHNRVADELARLSPHWHGEELYQEARRVVGAQIQHITYRHWLPLVLGPDGMRQLGDYAGYDPTVEPTISNAFATAAFRFGHGLVGPVLHRLNETFQPIPQGNLPLHRAFFAPWRLVQEGGVDPILRGLFASPAKVHTPDQLLNAELTEKLFSLHHQVSLDLAAINMQRGRDHGLPGYNAWRRHCGLRAAASFADFAREIRSARARDELRQLYGHPDNVDLWIGGMLEEHAPGAKMGPTFVCLLADQFRRLRDGDRFWYEAAGVFTPGQLAQLKQTNLARILCDNGDALHQVARDVFRVPERQSPRIIDCESTPQVDLRMWVDCKSCRGEDCSAEGARPGRARRSVLLSTHNHLTDPAPAPAPAPAPSPAPAAAPTSVPAPAVADIYHMEDVTEERIQGLEEVMARMHRSLVRMRKQLRRLQQSELGRRQQRRRHRRLTAPGRSRPGRDSRS
ncbi:LOW QUALITY PROTEIN: peroxidasin homolog [Pollicipes pollicipes]|uniref:LOW QUALITY PROTEIN: peroxidasin homolog n=1 Tax=Pollicipes pollicipes TaxID=41117 RepID=UPI00188559BD|nr:LOW QUALITY PROTEIN: peroxidasin homolog [Pollicipes pollicipes]